MKRILITGSNGQLGQTFQELGPRYPDLVFVFMSSEQLDVSSKKEISDYFKNNQFDFCINCAAYTNVEQAEKLPEKAYKINAEGVKYLALACQSNHITLIHISTDYVFDGKKDGAYVVGDKTNPINEYGKSKLKGEEYIHEILSNHFIIRTSWLYSKKYGHNFYRTILNKAKKGEELRITDEQKGCPTETETVVKFILDEIILGKKEYGTYHVTDEMPMTWYNFAEQILKDNGLAEKANLVLDRNYRTFAKRPKNSVLS